MQDKKTRKQVDAKAVMANDATQLFPKYAQNNNS